jgi:hypothetical protein
MRLVAMSADEMMTLAFLAAELLQRGDARGNTLKYLVEEYGRSQPTYPSNEGHSVRALFPVSDDAA